MAQCKRCDLDDLEWRESLKGKWVLWEGSKPHFLSCPGSKREALLTDEDQVEAPPPPQRTPRQQEIDALADVMDDERVDAVHEGLIMLAEMLDGVGFSKPDVDIGHRLARQDRISERQAAMGVGILAKYRMQLPVGLYAVIKGGS